MHVLCLHVAIATGDYPSSNLMYYSGGTATCTSSFCCNGQPLSRALSLFKKVVVTLWNIHKNTLCVVDRSKLLLLTSLECVHIVSQPRATHLFLPYRTGPGSAGILSCEFRIYLTVRAISLQDYIYRERKALEHNYMNSSFQASQ